LTSTGAEENNSSPPPKQVIKKKPTIIWKGQSLDESDAANRMNRDFYHQKYEHEDTTIQRKYLIMWYDITAAQKDARADKEMEMLILTRRNNTKMKIEVRGVMNAVIFGLWKNWARSKIARREEWRLQEEREKKEREEEKRREEMRDRKMRMSDVKQRMSWMTGSRRSSFSIARDEKKLLKELGSSTATPETDTSLKKAPKKPQPATNVTNVDSMNFRPFAPARPQKAKPSKSVPSKRQTTRLHVTASTPLSEEMARAVDRLANPPNYVPAYMKRDSNGVKEGDFQLNFGTGEQQDGTSNQNNPLVGNNLFIFNEGDVSIGDTEEDSFDDTLTKMYYDHMSKVKKNTAKKLRERNKARTPRNHPPPVSPKGEKTPVQIEKIKQLRIKQREISDRLYQGKGASNAGKHGEEDELGQQGPAGTLRRRGTRMKPKKSVLVQALKKEKESMLKYLDRLITPRGLGDSGGTI